MTNQIHKIFFLLTVLTVSFNITSCSEGDRDFIALPVTPEPEVVEELYVTGGAVKGPLVNADISIYKLDLSEGMIGRFNRALSVWLELLDSNELTLADDGYVLGSIPEGTVIQNLKDQLAEYGYVTELRALKEKLQEEDNYEHAKLLIEAFIQTDESNSKVSDAVSEIYSDVATLGELKREVDALSSLTDELQDAESFSEAKSILSGYQSKETDPKKVSGLTLVSNELERLSAESTAFSVSAIREYFEVNIYEAFLDSFILQDDPVARQNIITLNDALASSSSVLEAKEYIETALKKEGNIDLKSALSQLNSKVVTVEDFKDVVLSHEAFYHDFGIKDAINNGSSLESIYLAVSELFQNNLEPSFRGSVFETDDDDIEINKLSFGLTNDKGFLEGLIIGDYRGFVYLKAKVSNQTIDLNSGKAPIFDEMETIFHTDDILGYGDNEKEDLTVYHLLDGLTQRDSDGKIIKDLNELEDVETKELISVRPHYMATPLTHLGIELTLEKLKKLVTFKQDADLDSFPDNRISESILKDSLKASDSLIREALGAGGNEAFSVFSTPAMRLAHMKYFPEQELNAIRHRLSIENFSSFAYDLMKLTNLSSHELLPLLAEDLSDEQIDGYKKDSPVATLSELPQIDYLVQKSPTERLIPDTSKRVSDVFFLMNEEFSTSLPGESLNLFSTQYTDLTISGPIGGIDSDSDGVLNNEDQFPNDPNKSRLIDSGYKGIWSVNFNASETAYMPITKPYNFNLNKEEVEGVCINEPCIGVGDLNTSVIDDFVLISAPENHDFIITENNDSDVIGFSAFATMPGDYLVKATLTTDVEPIQTYTLLIPIHVLDPKKIEITFDPVDPIPGEAVSVKFKATKALCSLYPVCGAYDLDDNQDDFLDLSLLGDVFSIHQALNRDGELRPYADVLTSTSTQSNISNLELDDSVAVTVRFTAGDRDYVVASNTNSVGNDIDSDGDTVPDIDDLFPNDGLCHLEKDGILDSNFDLDINSLDSPSCFAGIVGQATVNFDVGFLNETWHYNPSWHFIIREYKFSTGFNGYIKTPTLQGTKELITIFKEDPINKRVYLAYKNGEVDYFSLENQSIESFLPSDSFSSINSLNLLGQYLLVEYVNPQGSFIANLYNAQGELADIRGENLYPNPGEAVSITIDGLNLISATNSLLNIEWNLEREDDSNNILQVPFQLSSDNLTLLSGQTAFKDVIKLTFTFDDSGRSISFSKHIFVLGFSSIDFEDNNHDSNEPLVITLNGFDPSLLDSPSDIIVKWFKNDKNHNDYNFVLSDKRYPFVLEEVNFSLGDMIIADVVLQHGQDELLVERLDVVILGNVDELRPVIDTDQSQIDIPTREVSFTLSNPTENDEYFISPNFVPIWYINGVIIEGENQLTFPTLDTTNLKYGDTISVSYSYDINGQKGETSPTFVAKIDTKFDASQFELSQKVYEVGQDASLGEDYFTEAELLNLEAKWQINGVVDVTEKDFSYSSEKLAYGDKIELFIQPRGNDQSNLNSIFTHVAEGYVGINLSSLAAQTVNPENDLDSDNDGIPNHQDYFRFDSQCSMENEGIPDDIDNDGINDLNELKMMPPTNPNLSDSDMDGLSDYHEIYVHFTDPNSSDTDSDGYSDAVEIDLQTDPNNINDPATVLPDNDFDGLTNEEELLYKTKVNVFDTDGDGLSDWYELNKSNTDPLSPDTDNDGLSDGVEVFITNTNPTLSDSDGDTLLDGVEVALGLDPRNHDTDGNGISDNNESGFDFNITLPHIFYQDDLVDYNDQFSEFLSIPSGTCFKTWMAKNSPVVIAKTHIDQVDSASYQELAFVSEKSVQAIRYDVQSKAFIDPINVDLSENLFISSLEYDANDIDKIYVGLSNGEVRLFNAQNNTLSKLFDTGLVSPITVIIDQGDFLIVEQQDASQNLKHSFFALSSPNTDPVATIDSEYTYKNSIWLNSNRQSLLSFDPLYSETSFIQETFDLALINPVLTSDVIDLGVTLSAPLYIEKNGGDDILRFGSGHGYNASNTASSVAANAPFSIGFEHENHRVVALKNSSFIEMTTLNDIDNGFWRFRAQLENSDLLALIPTGNHIFAVTYEPANSENINGKIAFQSVILGDENSDGLPDWWQNLSSALTEADFNNFRLTNDASIPDFFDGSPNIDDSIDPALLVDTDGDQICDHWEQSLFGTDPLKADTDADGMSDAQEIGLIPTSPLDCSVYPQFVLISNPLNPDSDSDGLLDGDEYFVHGTDVLNSDSDSDGLTDYQELILTFSDPLVSDPISRDSDNDGLSDAYELNISKTDHTNADSDNDGLSDYDEVIVYGTNPNSQDTDGDGLSDFEEISLHGTDPSSIDTDQDGLTDFEELDNSKGFTTDPTLSDTDGDGLDDLFESTFEFEYSDILLEFLNPPPGNTPPRVTLNPNAIDTDGDGICDIWEVNLFNSNPGEADTDGDHLSDTEELGITLDGSGIVDCNTPPVSNPISVLSNPDSDGDNILDGHEVYILNTDPKDKDSDDNNINDDLEDFDLDRLTNYQELYQTLTDPFLSDEDNNGVTDDLEDFDGDGLTNYDELNLYDTDPRNPDTDGNGILDGDEIALGLNPRSLDTDQDGLTDYKEINEFFTDPLLPDTDNDGLTDGEEAQLRTDPLNPDSDHDFILDGDDEFPLNHDVDADGIIDGIELYYLNTEFDDVDSDNDGLLDSYEVWVYAYEYDQDNQVITDNLLTTGVDSDLPINSKYNVNDWPAPEKFSTITSDKIILDLLDVANPSVIKGKLYVHRYSNPASIDSDGDGLSDITEFSIEEKYGLAYPEDPTQLEDFDPLKTNAINFIVSNPWNVDTNENGIDDGQEDIDGDFYINVLDQDNLDANVVEYDQDNDNLPDGLEALLLNTNPSNIDTDGDGINDDLELRSWSYQEISATDLCSSDEIRLSEVAGTDYCFTIEYKSYPYLIDSDNDGVADRFVDQQSNTIMFDHFPLDPTCYLVSDGFTKDDQSVQCYSSWMAESENIELIEPAEWMQGGVSQAQVLFYTAGWDKIIRYDLLEKAYAQPISISSELKDLVFKRSNNSLYLLYSDKTIEEYNIETGVRQFIAYVPVDNNEAQQLLLLGDSRLLLQTLSVNGLYTSVVIDLNGTQLSTFEGHNLDLVDHNVICLNDNCNGTVRVYGFIKDTDGNNVNVGALDIDMQSDEFLPAMIVSNTLSSGDDIFGPIKLSQDQATISLGSSQILNLNLQDSDMTNDLSIDFNGNIYNQYYDFNTVFDHFIGIVDYDTFAVPGSSETLTTENGTIVNDLSSQLMNPNTYLLPPVSLDEQILGLFDFTDTGTLDLIYVSKFTDSVLIENFGVSDQDGDGMPGIYEVFYSLDDSDPDDKFADPDGDGLVNIEEYLYATDPNKQDTDGDGWSDLYEVLNNTNPTDALDY